MQRNKDPASADEPTTVDTPTTAAAKSRHGRVRCVPNFAAMAAGTVDRRGERLKEAKSGKTPSKAAARKVVRAVAVKLEERTEANEIESYLRSSLDWGQKTEGGAWSAASHGPAGAWSLAEADRSCASTQKHDMTADSGRGDGRDEEEDDDDEDDLPIVEERETPIEDSQRWRGQDDRWRRDWEMGAGFLVEENDIDMATGMPYWLKDSEFLTEPLEGHKAYYILHNRDKMRAYFQARDPATDLFATYDRHPPKTALEPQSGVVYFIRTEEGLQDKAISLKSVATGRSKYTWKMAWGRKTHLKKWGILYKSYRCREMFQPKTSPPPFRMQIYVLEQHDPDLNCGHAPAPGHVLVQILSLQDAPLRRRAGVKREAEEGLDEDGSVDLTPSSRASRSFPSTASRSSPLRSFRFSPHGVAQRLDMGQGSLPRGSARRRLHGGGFSQRPPTAHRPNHHPNPLHTFPDPPVHSPARRLLQAAHQVHDDALASLPAQASMLQRQFGQLGTAVLAGMLSGQPWGLPALSSDGRLGACSQDIGLSPDYTALGWAELILLSSAREVEDEGKRRDAELAEASTATEDEEQSGGEPEDGGLAGLSSLCAAAESQASITGTPLTTPEKMTAPARPQSTVDQMQGSE